MPIAVVKAWPALIARESVSSASGKFSSNLRTRTVRLRSRTTNGSATPKARPIRPAHGSRTMAATANASPTPSPSAAISTVLAPVLAPD